MAVGRQAQTAKLGLDAAGVKFDIDTDGKIPVVDEVTNRPHIYALGDVITGSAGMKMTRVKLTRRRADTCRHQGGETAGQKVIRIE